MKRILRAVGIALAFASASACKLPDIVTFNTGVHIDTTYVEEDSLYGYTASWDPYRAYSGSTPGGIEKNGYRYVSGRTDQWGQDYRQNLSVPNQWTMYNDDGPCAGSVTYDAKLVDLGRATLKCHYTSVGHNPVSVLGLLAISTDGDGNSVTSPTNMGTSVLYSDQQLQRNQGMFSPNGDYQLVMLDDGNVVMYEDGLHLLWNLGTSGSHFIMQSDGNLVVYDAGWGVQWSSGTYGNAGAYLAVQDDGNLVIYNAGGVALWTRAGGAITYTGRYKWSGDSCYWEPNDNGPDQCQPYVPSGRYKWGDNGCYWDQNDDGPDQCQP